MITRIRSSFVEEADRFTIQSHKLTLKPNISNLSDIVLPTTPVIFDKQGD